MLLMLEDEIAKDEALVALEESITSQLADQGIKNIGFPSGNADVRLYSNGSGKLWAAFSALDDAPVPRRWNAFGIYDAQSQAQTITVEINVPTRKKSARVAGFFAKDANTDAVYLLHDGRVGGGKRGISKTKFLAWSKATREDVADGTGNVRAGIVIGRVDSREIVSRIWHFVQLVQKFKVAAINGELSTPEMQQAVTEWGNFSSESSGRRRGRRRAAIDYISYHGEVVECLYQERNEACKKGERVLNSQLIDLFVRDGTEMTEIYEVKTRADRQSIYTGIGQLLSHSANASPEIRRTLILPEGDIPADLEESLKALSIKMRHFTVSSGKMPKVILRPLT